MHLFVYPEPWRHVNCEVLLLCDLISMNCKFSFKIMSYKIMLTRTMGSHQMCWVDTSEMTIPAEGDTVEQR